MRPSSIGDGGIGTKCAENTTRKKCAEIPRSNISGMPRSNRKMCKNPKVKYFRNLWNVRNFRNAKVKFPKVKWENKNGKNPKVKYFRNLWNVWNVKTKKWETGKKRKKLEKWEKWEMEKWESVTKIKNQKHLKRY